MKASSQIRNTIESLRMVMEQQSSIPINDQITRFNSYCRAFNIEPPKNKSEWMDLSTNTAMFTKYAEEMHLAFLTVKDPGKFISDIKAGEIKENEDDLVKAINKFTSRCLVKGTRFLLVCAMASFLLDLDIFNNDDIMRFGVYATMAFVLYKYTLKSGRLPHLGPAEATKIGEAVQKALVEFGLLVMIVYCGPTIAEAFNAVLTDVKVDWEYLYSLVKGIGKGSGDIADTLQDLQESTNAIKKNSDYESYMQEHGFSAAFLNQNSKQIISGSNKLINAITMSIDGCQKRYPAVRLNDDQLNDFINGDSDDIKNADILSKSKKIKESTIYETGWTDDYYDDPDPGYGSRFDNVNVKCPYCKAEFECSESDLRTIPPAGVKDTCPNCGGTILLKSNGQIQKADSFKANIPSINIKELKKIIMPALDKYVGPTLAAGSILYALFVTMKYVAVRSNDQDLSFAAYKFGGIKVNPTPEGFVEPDLPGDPMAASIVLFFCAIAYFKLGIKPAKFKEAMSIAFVVGVVTHFVATDPSLATTLSKVVDLINDNFGELSAKIVEKILKIISVVLS